MAEWRFSRGWSEGELRDRLARLSTLACNFAVPLSEMTVERGWTRDGVTARLGAEPPGRPAPGGSFERARRALETFQFSDPRIVVWYFDPTVPFATRNLLLEIRALGLRYLCGARASWSYAPRSWVTAAASPSASSHWRGTSSEAPNGSSSPKTMRPARSALAFRRPGAQASSPTGGAGSAFGAWVRHTAGSGVVMWWHGSEGR